MVTCLKTSKKTGDTYSETLAVLGKGNSFGVSIILTGTPIIATCIVPIHSHCACNIVPIIKVMIVVSPLLDPLLELNGFDVS